MKLRHIKELDAVRGIAALSIMWLHFTITLHGSTFLNLLGKTSSIFQFGVPLFFVLSGFLITRILLATKNDRRYFINFYAKRSVRIFPLYYLLLFIYFVILPLLLHEPLYSFKEIWTNFFYLQNVAMTLGSPTKVIEYTWSLAVEEHFYLVWPFLIYRLNVKSVKRLIYAILILEPLIRFVFLKNGYAVYYFTLTRLDELCLGALLAVQEAEGHRFTRKHILSGMALLVGGAAMWLMVSGKKLHIVEAFKFSYFAILFYTFIGFIVLNHNVFLKKALSLKPLFYAGTISYGLYIYHPVCHTLLAEFNIHSLPLQFVAYFAGTFVIATLSYYLYESQFLRLKKYFTPKGMDYERI